MKNIAFYIASRYLTAKKGSTAVTFITWLAVTAMCFAVAVMFIFVSVFAGLEDLNRDLISNLHSDLTIQSKEGKTLQNIRKIESALKKNKEIAHFSKIIEEKVYVDYHNKGEIAYLRGVDSAYTSINPINEKIFFGTYPSFTYSNEVLIEHQLSTRLGIPVGSEQDFGYLYMPKPGEGIISREEDIFNKKEIFATGVFPGNDQLNNYIIAPVELAQELLNLPKGTAYQIVIKLKNSEEADNVRSQLLQELGTKVEIKTKAEENAAFWKMINTEKMFIYFIFALVLLITTFNLAGAVIILQLDKKEQARALVALGFSVKDLRRVYFYTGLLIVCFGIIAGLFIGTLVCLIQIYTGVFKAGSLPFPVRIVPENYLYVFALSAFFGVGVSWLFSKINKQYLTKN